MAFDPSGQNQRFMSEINVTPFVDVMLVLLVIFMVMAPHFAAMPGLEISLPEVQPGAAVATSDRVEISVTAGGDIFVDGQPVTPTALKDALRQAAPNPATTVVILMADENTTHGRIVALMDVLRQLSLKKVVIAARWRETPDTR
jgi:biopolymer transport protein ExbD